MPLADLATFPYPPGTILYVKTTDEPVVYLSTIAASQPETHPSPLFFVRRPIQTRDGLRYDFAELYECELETGPNRDSRLLIELKHRQTMTKEALEDPSSEPRPTNFLKN